MRTRTARLSLTSACAALYAGFGYLTYLGIFTPVVGVVRFWPAVIIPALFSVIFGPLIGGLGAAIGIFISDLVIHGNALLSLTVGVPANFIGFYLIGVLSRRNFNWKSISLFSVFLFGVIALVTYFAEVNGMLGNDVALVLLGTCALTLALLLLIGSLWKEWRSYEVASFIGLLVGSGIIGLGVWGFSQFFVLPQGGFKLPIYVALIWFLWTFLTEIPFLVVLGPPALKVLRKAVPSGGVWR